MSFWSEPHVVLLWGRWDMSSVYVDDLLYLQYGYAGSGRPGTLLMSSCVSCASGFVSVVYIWLRQHNHERWVCSELRVTIQLRVCLATATHARALGLFGSLSLCGCNWGRLVLLQHRRRSAVLEDDSPLAARLSIILFVAKCGEDTGSEEVHGGLPLFFGSIAKPSMLIREEFCQ